MPRRQNPSAAEAIRKVNAPKSEGDSSISRLHQTFRSLSGCVVLAIPIHKFRQPFFNRSAGPESRSFVQVVHMGVSGNDIAGLHWKKLFARLDAESAFHDLDKLEQVDGPMVPQVVDFVARIAQNC